MKQKDVLHLAADLLIVAGSFAAYLVTDFVQPSAYFFPSLLTAVLIVCSFYYFGLRLLRFRERQHRRRRTRRQARLRALSRLHGHCPAPPDSDFSRPGTRLAEAALPGAGGGLHRFYQHFLKSPPSRNVSNRPFSVLRDYNYIDGEKPKGNAAGISPRPMLRFNPRQCRIRFRRTGNAGTRRGRRDRT